MSVPAPFPAPRPAPLSGPALTLPTIVAVASPDAQARLLEFFAANIRNPHTRRAYLRGCVDFLAWCEERGVAALNQVQPLHVAGWVETLGRTVSAPTVKQRLAGVRHLFDWLVVSQIVPTNPAASVRGPAHSQRRGKTPALEPSELIDAIDVSTPVGLPTHRPRTTRPYARRSDEVALREVERILIGRDNRHSDKSTQAKASNLLRVVVRCLRCDDRGGAGLVVLPGVERRGGVVGGVGTVTLDPETQAVVDPIIDPVVDPVLV